MPSVTPAFAVVHSRSSPARGSVTAVTDRARWTSGNILRVMRAVEAVAAAKKNEQPSLARLEPAA